MSEANSSPSEVLPEKSNPPLSSVDVAMPPDQGGTIARKGFNYQDQVAVSFLLQMIEDADLEKVHCETHDDIVLVRAGSATVNRRAEYVQVKSDPLDQLWSPAKLCERTNGKIGTSIYERSLSRDQCIEASLFRVCTQVKPNQKLECLTTPLGAPQRDPKHKDMASLIADLETKCEGATSKKGNGAQFWSANCIWHHTESEAAVRNKNLACVIRLASLRDIRMLHEQADTILRDLLVIAKDAASAPLSELSRKIITRLNLIQWWSSRLEEIADGSSQPAGGKLRGKLEAASLPTDTILLAIDCRRRYAELVRSNRYLVLEDRDALIDKVRSRAMSLQMEADSSEEPSTGAQFHKQCLDAMDKIALEHVANGDLSVFTRGCLYDIADRCLHRFARAGK